MVIRQLPKKLFDLLVVATDNVKNLKKLLQARLYKNQEAARLVMVHETIFQHRAIFLKYFTANYLPGISCVVAVSKSTEGAILSLIRQLSLITCKNKTVDTYTTLKCYGLSPLFADVNNEGA